jgi:hypothetical protein
MRIVVLVGVFLLHLTSLACAITGRAEGAPNPTASSARATTVDVVRTAFRHMTGTDPTEGSLTGGLTANAFAAHGGGGGGGHAGGFGTAARGTHVGGWTAKEIHQAILTPFEAADTEPPPKARSQRGEM